MIGWALTALNVVGLLAIGIGGIVAPRSASKQYGIVLDDARSDAFLRAMAARDLVIGGLLAMLALVATRQTLGWAMCLTALIAVIDLLVVTADRRATSRPSLGQATMLHAGGAAGLLITAAVLFAGY